MSEYILVSSQIIQKKSRFNQNWVNNPEVCSENDVLIGIKSGYLSAYLLIAFCLITLIADVYTMVIWSSL